MAPPGAIPFVDFPDDVAIVTELTQVIVWYVSVIANTTMAHLEYFDGIKRTSKISFLGETDLKQKDSETKRIARRSRSDLQDGFTGHRLLFMDWH